MLSVMLATILAQGPEGVNATVRAAGAFGCTHPPSPLFVHHSLFGAAVFFHHFPSLIHVSENRRGGQDPSPNILEKCAGDDRQAELDAQYNEQDAREASPDAHLDELA